MTGYRSDGFSCHFTISLRENGTGNSEKPTTTPDTSNAEKKPPPPPLSQVGIDPGNVTIVTCAYGMQQTISHSLAHPSCSDVGRVIPDLVSLTLELRQTKAEASTKFANAEKPLRIRSCQLLRHFDSFATSARICDGSEDTEQEAGVSCQLSEWTASWQEAT